MLKALTGVVLLFISGMVCGQTWQYTSPKIGYFNYSGNRIGIGTATPQKLLHLVGNSASPDGVEAMIEATDDWYASLTFKSHNRVWSWSKRPSFEGDAMQLWYLDGAGGGWQGPYFTVTTNGSVGIGTVKTGDASYKLFVETGIRTRRVTVDQVNPWPDYVFSPEYRLPSLSSVAEYIKAHRHLPDMPSADSVAKSGIDLGNTETQLVKKIEELTLYTIEQQQQLEELKQQNKKLQDQMERLMEMYKKAGQ